MASTDPVRLATRRPRTVLTGSSGGHRAEPAAPGRCAGFTLLEVMVAMAVAALVLLGARVILGEVADGAGRIAAAAAEADRAANAESLLRTVAGRLEAGGETRRFSGDPRGARFHSWCEVPDGWLERCTATLGFVRAEDENVLALTLSTGEVVPLRRGFEDAEILYLRDPADGGSWIHTWGAGITAPWAFGLVVDGDTAIVRIGERG